MIHMYLCEAVYIYLFNCWTSPGTLDVGYSNVYEVVFVRCWKVYILKYAGLLMINVSE